jgi:NADH dehydrogenase FAD-containing subunit
MIKKGWHGKYVQIVMIDRKDAFNHVPAAPRSMVVKGFAERQFYPYSNWSILAKEKLQKGATAESSFKFVQGDVTEVTDDGVKVTTAEGPVSIPHDYCLIATGSSIPFPVKGAEPSGAKSSAAYGKRADALERAESVLVIGGGYTGLETAGELGHLYKGKKTITLVHGGSAVLNHVTNIKPKAQQRLTAKLAKLGVTVKLNTRVDLSSIPKQSSGAEEAKGEGGDESKTASVPSMAVSLDKPIDVKLSDGTVVKANVVLLCGGGKVQNSAYAASLGDAVDERGRLKVGLDHRVVGHPKLFALGDCCDTDEPKLMYCAHLQAQHLVENFARLLKGKPLKKRKLLAHGTGFCTLGPKDGVAQLPNGMLLGSVAVPKLKGSDMAIGKVRSEYFTKAIAKGKDVQA